MNPTFSEINSAVLANPSFIESRLPDCHYEGKRIHADTLHGGKGRSFNINTETGAWFDQATGECGGDTVSLVAAQDGISQGEAAKVISEALGLVGNNTLARKELPSFTATNADWKKPAAVYPYYYKGGTEPAFFVLRMERKGYKKEYRQSSGLDYQQNWKKGNQKPTCLYNLVTLTSGPGIDVSDFVVVVEGENKANALIAAGICATCNPGGAGKWKDEYSQDLAGKAIICLPDNDDVGKKHMQTVAASAHGVAGSVKVLNLPGLPHKGDILDWLEVPDNDFGKLRALMNEAPHWKPGEETEKPEGKHPFFSLSPEDCSFRRFKGVPPELPMVIDGLGFRGMAGVIAGNGGVGKTSLALQLCAMLATKKPLLGNVLVPKVQGSTLVILPEDPEIPIHQKVYRLADALKEDGDTLLSYTYGPDAYGMDIRLIAKTTKGLTTTEAFDALLAFAKRIPDLACIILDPLNLLHDVDVEESAGTAQYFASRMAYLAKETNSLVLVAHHTTKGEKIADKDKLEGALHQSVIRGTGAIVNGFRAALTLAELPPDFARKHLNLAQEPKRGEYIAGLVPKFNYAPKGNIFFLRRDDNAVLWPVETEQAKRTVQKIEKTMALVSVIPRIVAEIASQEAQDKRFTKATFALVYNKEWTDSPQNVLKAAIERALADGYLCIDRRPASNGRESDFLTVTGAEPLPTDDSPPDLNTWLNGADMDEVQ